MANTMRDIRRCRKEYQQNPGDIMFERVHPASVHPDMAEYVVHWEGGPVARVSPEFAHVLVYSELPWDLNWVYDADGHIWYARRGKTFDAYGRK